MQRGTLPRSLPPPVRDGKVSWAERCRAGWLLRDTADFEVLHAEGPDGAPLKMEIVRFDLTVARATSRTSSRSRRSTSRWRTPRGSSTSASTAAHRSGQSRASSQYRGMPPQTAWCSTASAASSTRPCILRCEDPHSTIRTGRDEASRSFRERQGNSGAEATRGGSSSTANTAPGGASRQKRCSSSSQPGLRSPSAAAR